MPCLLKLDLRFNLLKNLSEVVDILKWCPVLEILYLENSTKSKKESSQPRSYLNFVCQKLRNLILLDDLNNPYGISHSPAHTRANSMRLASPPEDPNEPPSYSQENFEFYNYDQNLNNYIHQDWNNLYTTEELEWQSPYYQ